MKAVKFLERSVVIRFFGACLFLAPFINIVTHAYLQSLKSEVTGRIIWKSLTVGTFAQNMQNVMTISSIAIGVIMLLGIKKAWSFVLGLIGLQIVIQTTTLLKDLKENWFWGVVFLINLGIFFFIADQLVFKEKRDEKEDEKEKEKTSPQVAPATPVAETSIAPATAVVPSAAAAPVPPAPQERPMLTTRRRIFIHLSDLKMWAQLLHISNAGLLVKSMEKQPITFSDKTMVVFLRADLRLSLKLQYAKGDEVFFEFLPMSAQEIRHLNDWILEKSDLKRSSLESNINSLSFTQKVS